jgi:hypothetical protein
MESGAALKCLELFTRFAFNNLLHHRVRLRLLLGRATCPFLTPAELPNFVAPACLVCAFSGVVPASSLLPARAGAPPVWRLGRACGNLCLANGVLPGALSAAWASSAIEDRPRAAAGLMLW